jgi:Kelch motif
VNGRDLLFGAGSTAVTNAVQDVTPGAPHAGRQVTDVQRVDPSGPGSVAGHLLRPLAHAGAFTLGGTVFVAGGRTGGTATDTLIRLDPAQP